MHGGKYMVNIATGITITMLEKLNNIGQFKI